MTSSTIQQTNPNLVFYVVEILPTQKNLISLSSIASIILETAVQDGEVVQDFELESLTIRGEHSQKVKAPRVVSDYGSKDCVNLPSSTAVSRIIPMEKMSIASFPLPTLFVLKKSLSKKGSQE